jgi:hypothetical protein
MSAFGDAWSHAQNVRMWMAQAYQELGTSIEKSPGSFLSGWLSGGRTAKGNADSASESLAQARLAWIDLAFWLEKAGQQVPQRFASLDERFVVKTGDAGLGSKYKMNADVVEQRLAVLRKDIAALDGLIQWLASQQAK